MCTILNSDRFIICPEDSTVKSLSLWPEDIEYIMPAATFSTYFPNIKSAHRIVPINKLYDASALSQTFVVSNA